MTNKIAISKLTDVGSLEATDRFIVNTEENTKTRSITVADLVKELDISPVNNNYYSVLEFGSTPSETREEAISSGDQSGFIQDAMDSIPDGSLLFFPAGHYLITNRVTCDKSIHILAHGAKFYVDTVGAFLFDVTEQAKIIDLTASYVKGEKKIFINYKDRDNKEVSNYWPITKSVPFKIISRAVDGGNRDTGNVLDSSGKLRYYHNAEWNVAYDLRDTNSTDDPGAPANSKVLEMRQPLRFTRGVSYNENPNGDEMMINSYDLTFNEGGTTYPLEPQILILSGHTMSWTGGEIEYKETITGLDGTAISINGYSHPVVTDLRVLNGYDPGIYSGGNVYPKYTKLHIENLRDSPSNGNYGYGLDEGGTWMGNLSNSTFIDTRHGYTTGATAVTWDDNNEPTKNDKLRSGKTQSSVISNCIGSGQYSSPFDTHHCAVDMIFDNCIVDGGRTAFTLRGRGHILNNCKALNSTTGFLLFTEYYKRTDKNDVILNDLFTASKEIGPTTATLNNCVAHCINGTPLQMGACRRVVLNNLELKNTNHQLVVNNGSYAIFTGYHDYEVTTYDDQYPIEPAPYYRQNMAGNKNYYHMGAITTTAGGGQFAWQTQNTIEEGTVINIDMSKCLRTGGQPDGTGVGSLIPNALRGVRSYIDGSLPLEDDPSSWPDPSYNGPWRNDADNKLYTYMRHNGTIRVKMDASVSDRLMTGQGWITSLPDSHGEIVYELITNVSSSSDEKRPATSDDYKDKTFFTVPVYGHLFKVRSIDDSIIYDMSDKKLKIFESETTEDIANNSNRPYTDTITGNGTFYPNLALSHHFDTNGVSVKQVVRAERLSGGSSTFSINIGSEPIEVVTDETFSDFLEVEAYLFMDGPESTGVDDSATAIFCETRVHISWKTRNNSGYVSQVVETDYNRLQNFVFSIRQKSTDARIKYALVETQASYISSDMIFQQELDRINESKNNAPEEEGPFSYLDEMPDWFPFDTP